MVRLSAQWKRGAISVHGLDAEACERELSKLHSSGILTPKSVVDAARDPESPLHSGFTWDDSEAAEQWRLREAQSIIRALVVVESHPEGDRQVRCYVNVKPLEDDEKPQITDVGVYIKTSKALSIPKYRDQVLRQALRDAEAYADKYRDLEELSRIVRAIDATVKQFEREHAIA